MENTNPNSAAVELVDGVFTATPIGIVRSRNAFLRDLPTLLANPKYDRWYAAYSGDERIGIAASSIELIRECQRRGFREDECYIGCIFPHTDEEEEEIKGAFSFVEYDDDEGTFSGPAIENERLIP